MRRGLRGVPIMDRPRDAATVQVFPDPQRRFRALFYVDMGNGITITMLMNSREVRRLARDARNCADACEKAEKESGSI